MLVYVFYLLVVMVVSTCQVIGWKVSSEEA